ncbi:MFS transporter, partial [Acinetobacter baumannii]
DRFSRKPLVVFGLLLFAIGGAIAGLSDTIYGVIIGRAIAGAGAVSAVVMALLADVTREEQRTKAMAAMGMSIGLSFVVAFSLGPWLTSLVGISGLFFVTTIMGLIAIAMLLLVPKVTRHHRNYQQGYMAQLKQVIQMGDLNRLHVSVFALHLLLTAMFIYVPSQLIEFAHIPLASHGLVYLPLLVISLFFAFPSIIIAEKYRKMRGIFLTAITGIIAGLLLLIFGYQSKYVLLAGLGIFFIAFNVMEALLPSWLSKSAPIQSKATAMGMHSKVIGLFAIMGIISSVAFAEPAIQPGETLESLSKARITTNVITQAATPTAQTSDANAEVKVEDIDPIIEEKTEETLKAAVQPAPQATVEAVVAPVA